MVQGVSREQLSEETMHAVREEILVGIEIDIDLTCQALESSVRNDIVNSRPRCRDRRKPLFNRRTVRSPLVHGEGNVPTD